MFSVIRESIFFRPRETDFRFFVINEICIYFRVIYEPKTCGNNFLLFLEILASLKLVNYAKLDVKPAHLAI